jgi:chromosome partitioning protein
MILLIGGEKGGSGKSTIACNISTYLAYKTLDVLLIDADPQKSTANWSSRRQTESLQTNNPCIACAEKTDNIYDFVQSLSKKYKHIIIDSGGRDSKELRSGLIIADVFYTPIKPSQIDIDTLWKMNELAEQAMAMNSKLKCYSIITHAPTNPHMDDELETQKILSKIPMFIQSKSVIKYRSSYWRTMGKGLSVLEYNDTKAIEEINSLGNEIYG